jgi:hypothetical protein
MGSDFRPFYADVIEAMKVAEAYEAAFPYPQEKLQEVADAILASTPTNALLFVHNDVFETILLLQQQKGGRGDILLVNSSRLMDQSYVQIILDRYPGDLRFEPTEMSKRVFAVARERKDRGDVEFRDLRVEGEIVHADGVQVVNSLILLMMQDIGRCVVDRPVLFLPSLHTPEPVDAWRSLENVGLFFRWGEPSARPGSDPIAEWQSLLDAAAPAGALLHNEMAEACAQSLYAAIGIFAAQGQKDVAGRLLGMWDQRGRTVVVVQGKEIVIGKDGKMVRQDKSSVR